jgi:hypothetical protein
MVPVKACSYFELGHGYQFSIYGQEIGMRVNSSMIGGELDTLYSAMQHSTVFDWDWTELQTLIGSYSTSYCTPVPGSGSEPPAEEPPVVVPPVEEPPVEVPPVQTNTTDELLGIWSQLDLSWAVWNESAIAVGMDFDSWTKDQWKEWLQYYVDYYMALRAYRMSHAADNSTVAYAPLTFQDVWYSTYNLPVIHIGAILGNIRDAGTVVQDLETWFVAFFGPEGYVTLNKTAPAVETPAETPII